MRPFLIAALAACMAASAAQAAPANDADEALFGLYVGQYSALRDSDNASITGGAEYRYKDVFYGIRPTIGAFAAGNSETYAYVGINWDLPLNIAPFYITPGFNIGGYDPGDGKRLGYALEFRSTLEASYQFPGKQRLGLAISHLSNAGLGNKNPGTETIQAVFVAPLW